MICNTQTIQKYQKMIINTKHLFLMFNRTNLKTIF